MMSSKSHAQAPPTLVALATPQGHSALAIIRLTGARSIELVDHVFKGKKATKTLKESGGYTLHYGQIEYQKEVIDEVMVSLYRAPYSYTGEDMVEVNCHGSPYIIQRLLGLFCARGAEMAPPGAFTQRAFLNGKMDLVQAEAICDLIQAETKAQHKIAMRQLKGHLSHRLRDLRETLIALSADLTLSLDFAEEDVTFASQNSLLDRLNKAHKDIETLNHEIDSIELIKKGIPIALIGRPNAGKSTLLNVLVKADKAMVSAIPGTTRDTLEVVVRMGNYLFRFIDTAGLRTARGQLEQLGVKRSLEQIKKAALVIYVFDARQKLNSKAISKEIGKKPILWVANKLDLLTSVKQKALSASGGYLLISARHNQGLSSLKSALLDKAKQLIKPLESVWITRALHRQKLTQAQQALKDATKALEARQTPELIAHDVETACRSIGEITGEIAHEDVLSHLFERFCIGK